MSNHANFIKWDVRGYAGRDDYDGPSDYNFTLMFITDKSVKKSDIEAIVQHRYENKRVLVFEVIGELIL